MTSTLDLDQDVPLGVALVHAFRDGQVSGSVLGMLGNLCWVHDEPLVQANPPRCAKCRVKSVSCLDDLEGGGNE